MTIPVNAPPGRRLHFGLAQSALLLAALAGLVVGLGSGVQWMVDAWLNTDEYSHGLLVPFVAVFLAWQRLPGLRGLELRGSWAGVAVVLAGLALGSLGQFGTVYVLQEYALVVVLAGLVLAIGGRPLLAHMKAPLGILLFMVPLPNFFLNNLSLQLQLLSSQLGVWFIRLFGISVFLEGNVIDLGTYKLQVAEACSGLRYLFPLLTLGFIIACFYRVQLWKRVLVLVSAVPLTLLMNSFRIGTIGFMVEHWGPSLAEGAVHEFQGWVLFMACGVILVLEARVLAWVTGDRRPWREVFAITLARAGGQGVAGGAPAQLRPLPPAFVAAAAVVLVFGLAMLLVPSRQEAIPARLGFDVFPAQLAGWAGQRTALEQVYLDTLMLDDYLLADYHQGNGLPVNLYVAWYNSQRSGQSAHSPRSCLPGGGWEFTSFEQRALPGVLVHGQPLRVNRAIIEQGDARLLVYYWFKQRDRNVTNEYAVKWYLFRDAIGRNRTDGALVRLVRAIPKGADVADADAELVRFAQAAVPALLPFVPD
jgi:exosortase D (VPLPA-CTERM-specific)